MMWFFPNFQQITLYSTHSIHILCCFRLEYFVIFLDIFDIPYYGFLWNIKHQMIWLSCCFRFLTNYNMFFSEIFNITFLEVLWHCNVISCGIFWYAAMLFSLKCWCHYFGHFGHPILCCFFWYLKNTIVCMHSISLFIWHSMLFFRKCLLN